MAQGKLSHADCFLHRAFHRKGRGLQDTLIQMGQCVCFFFFRHIRPLYQHVGQVYQPAGQGIKQQCIRYIKNGVEYGNPHAADSGFSKRLMKRKNTEHKYPKDNCPHYVEEQMNHRRPFGRPLGSQAGKKRRHTGADILPQGNIDGGAPGHYTVLRQGL